ncbi:hypothetical protein BD324DRAFT_649499 [Kockovaella imperatae]|uniref:R3H-associated N-terminal domain-containing protein n=1 Tax=Kockovaella imperatae TaxID=4999 RepID=A0A1Y1UPI5_9TREE|nr:hypothetical protein BD324DRAFT_649499 [Kockovaella imperatae]ORX39424.1 hypothetical protein BD324DRAFT_649499 [Kockovaella imperatae]
MSDSTDAGPVPLHIPAILLNPTNRAAKQLEAHNAQQRERVHAKRDKQSTRGDVVSGSKQGKRVIRRKDNAAFISNPHISLPTRSDYYPSVPLQARRGPLFPPETVPRSSHIPSVERPPRDPFSSDSKNGTFGTSLKGVRALLRNKGRRAEKLILVVEKEIRDWLDGREWINAEGMKEKDTVESSEDETDEPQSYASGSTWRLIDPTLVEITGSKSNGAGPSRRLPEQHQVRDVLPRLPSEGSHVAAVLELSRSPAHLTWTIADGFERLVVHLLARYYDLVSWSEDHQDDQNLPIRLTHIIIPQLVRPAALPPSHLLPTPETSDVSSHSEASTDRETESEASDTETELGGYSLDPDISQSTIQPGQLPWDQQSDPGVNGIRTPGIEDAMAELDLKGGMIRLNGLERVWSHDSSSAFGSSEGGSSDWDPMTDSLELPPRSRQLQGSLNGVIDDSASEQSFNLNPESHSAAQHHLNGLAQRALRGRGRGWEDRPTFFDYLYGE